jgi:hypothetical protein
MKTFLGIVAALAASLALAGPAHALDGVTASAALSGNAGWLGYHGSDPDRKRVWDYYEATLGVDIVRSEITYQWHPGGYNNQVGTRIRYTRANGSTIVQDFHSYDGRGFGTFFSDESWRRVS